MITTATQLPSPGIYPHMSDAEYFALPYASKSKLWALRDSPAHMHDGDIAPKPPTKDMIFGSAFDCYLLTPDAFTDRVAVKPEANARTNAGKAEIAAFETANAGKLIVTDEDVETFKNMAASFRAHAIGKLILSTMVRAQLVVISDDPDTGVRCKSKADGVCALKLPTDEHALTTTFDLKTARSADPHAFATNAEELGYPLQVVHYRKLAEGIDRLQGRTPMHRRFLFAVVEKTIDYGSRHRVEVYEYDEEDLRGMESVRLDLLRKWAECKQTNAYPGRIEAVNVLRRPLWAIREEANSFEGAIQ